MPSDTDRSTPAPDSRASDVLRAPAYPSDQVLGMGYFPDELDPLAPPSPPRADLRISGGRRRS